MKATLPALALVALTAGGAAPRTLPVPPIPPRGAPPPDAPVPDVNARAPNDPGSRFPVTLEMGILRRSDPNPSMGYAPGAHYQVDNDRRWLALPGVVLRVPLP